MYTTRYKVALVLAVLVACVVTFITAPGPTISFCLGALAVLAVAYFAPDSFKFKE